MKMAHCGGNSLSLPSGGYASRGQGHPGFITIEIVFALALGTLFMSASLMLVTTLDPLMPRTTLQDSGTLHYARLTDTALRNARTTHMERALHALKNDLFSTFAPVTDEGLTTTRTTVWSTPCLLELTSTTAYVSPVGMIRTYTATSALPDLTERSAYGDTCDPIPVSTWHAPTELSGGTLTIPGESSATDIITYSYENVPYALITKNPPLGSTEGELLVARLDRPPLTPDDVVGSLPYTHGIRRATYADGYLYALTSNPTLPFMTIDLTQPTLPSVVGIPLTLPGITCVYDPNTCQRIGRSIMYYDERLYIGMGYMAGNSPEFFVYDVSDPALPVFVQSLNVQHNINDIARHGDYAYLATSADYGELTMIDVHNPAILTLPPSYTNGDSNNLKFNAKNDSGDPSTEDGWRITVQYPYAYLGRARVNTAGEYDLVTLDITDPHALTEKGHHHLGLSQSNARVTDLIARGHHLFVGTSDTDQGFFILERSGATPVLATPCGFHATLESSTGVAVFENKVYLTYASGNPLMRTLVDSSNVCTP